MRINAYAPKIVQVNSTALIDAEQRYGITSSATADQTSRFQDMADDLSAGNAGAKTVILPAGEFHITDTVNFTEGKAIGFWPTLTTTQGYSGIHLIGQGRFATEIIMDTDNKPMFQFYNSDLSSNQIDGLYLEGFTLTGPGVENNGSVALAIGGVSSDDADIIARSSIKDILIRNFYSGMRLDDCTNFLMESCKIEGVYRGIEMGFNIDIFTALQCAFGSQVIPQSISCSITNGSPTITGISDTSNLRVGMRIVSSDFAQETEIASVDSGTQVTASTNATGATGASTFSCTMGTSIYYPNSTETYGGSTWPAHTTPGGQQAHKFIGCWFMRNSESFYIKEESAANIVVDSSYFERGNRIAKLGSSGSSTGTQFFKLENCHFSQNDNYQDYLIKDESASGGNAVITITNTRSDTTMNVPYIYAVSGNTKIDWDNNLLLSSTDLIDVATITYNPPNQTKWSYNLGGTNLQQVSLGTSGTLTPRIAPNTNSTFYIGPVDGAVTVNTPGAGAMNKMVGGETVTFIIREDGTAGHTISWNAVYQDSSGDSVTGFVDSTVTTDAGKSSLIQFVHDGNGKFIQVSPTNFWI